MGRTADDRLIEQARSSPKEDTTKGRRNFYGEKVRQEPEEDIPKESKS